MNTRRNILLYFLFFLTTLSINAQQVQFEKILVDFTYTSAGISAADIDRDGLPDIIAGDVWYKAPQWKRFEIRPLGTYYATKVIPNQPEGSGAGYYSHSIGNYTKDIDGDGWPDVITFNSQGAPCYWYRNPQGKFDQYWQEYEAIETFHNESPQIVDLFADGNPVVLAGHRIAEDKYSLSWFSIPADPRQLWQAHIIGHPDDFNYSSGRDNRRSYAPGGWGHGLGIGDIDGDGLNDVLTAQGWYEAPPDAKNKENWQFHPVHFDSLADTSQIGLLFAQMFADDFDGDGDNDVLGGSTHGYGLWWFEQVKNNKRIDFVKHEIRMDMSQLHAMNTVDLNGNGKKEYITGKRYLAHLGRDPGSSDQAIVAYVEQKTDATGKVNLVTRLIDDNSGSGTQIWIADMNGDKKPDVITSNKKGTHLFIQK